jgi:signal transduction histidine kinase
MGLVLLGLFALFKKTPDETTPHSSDLLAGALLAATIALLLVSKRFPATVAATQVGLGVLWYSRYTSRLIDVPTIVGFYVLGTTGDRRRQLLVGGATVALLLVGAAGDPSDAEISLEGAGWTVAAIVGGELVRSRRLLLGQYAERATRAEDERDTEAERRVASERLRIARDLHDVLAHTVSIMTVQAGVASDVVERGGDRDTVRSALATLRSAGKEAMAEVRAAVAVLRGAGPAGDHVETAPAPNLDSVTELVEAARGQGLDVELTTDVEAIEVKSLVELTAYRIVQESLTNVMRHAATTRAAVRIQADPSGRLLVEIVDDGRHPAPPPSPDVDNDDPLGPGFGLRGMTERVEAVGGDLSYGPMPGRGWAVRATLPARTALRSGPVRANRNAETTEEGRT